MDDDFDFVEAPDGSVFMLQDKTSARAVAYIQLLLAVRGIKEPELIAEGLEMLKRLRLSISVHSEGQLGIIKGGKPN